MFLVFAGIIVALSFILAFALILMPPLLMCSLVSYWYYSKNNLNEKLKRYSLIGIVIGGLGTLTIIPFMIFEDNPNEEAIFNEIEIVNEKNEDNLKEINNNEDEIEIANEVNKKDFDRSEVEDTSLNDSHKSIIFDESHPQYLDSIDNVLNFSKKHPKEKVSVNVLGGKGYSKYGDETIISYQGLKSDGYITDIQVYLSKVDEKININDSLSLINSYLSNEIVKNNYSIVESFKFISEKESKKESFVIKYQLNSEKENHIPFEIPLQFYAILEVENDTVDLIRLTKNTPKWMHFADKNGYKKEKWNIN